ncbi:hypothetical protein VNI00_012939 [Paramarasmius palmivorus]|uniref:Uncharacterized protein n=1 Tax=Paramarasmius palmivorus TaxID=297713 RepID=A0AAW0C205_9AGAR
MALTRSKARDNAAKQRNKPGFLRRRRSLRVLVNRAYQQDPTLVPVLLRPIVTRHVQWLGKELYKWFFTHIWDRTYVQGINEVHERLITRWPQYGFYNDDKNLQRLLVYTRKEEIREWLHRLAAMEMNYKGEYAKEVSDLGLTIAIEEYEQGSTVVREREPEGALAFTYKGIWYKFHDSRHVVKREIEGSFSLNKLLSDTLKSAWFTEEQLGFLARKREQYISARDLPDDPNDERFWDLIRDIVLFWCARWAPPLYLSSWDTEERAEWRRTVILQVVHLLDIDSRSVRGVAKLLKKLYTRLSAKSNWLYRVDDRAAGILNLPPSYKARDKPVRAPVYFPRYFSVIEANCTLRRCMEEDWYAASLRRIRDLNEMTNSTENEIGFI